MTTSHDGLARRSREVRLEGALHALESAVGALEADDVGGELAVGVEPQRLRHQTQPGLAQRSHRRGHGRREFATDPDERLVAREQRVELALTGAEERRQPRGHAHGIAHATRLGEERVGGGGGGQGRAVAVDDVPALGREHEATRVLTLRHLRQLGVADDLEPPQTRTDTPERHGEECGEDERARPEGGHQCCRGGGGAGSNRGCAEIGWARLCLARSAAVQDVTVAALPLSRRGRRRCPPGRERIRGRASPGPRTAPSFRAGVLAARSVRASAVWPAPPRAGG